MARTLYYHPLSSFCWKALIALYESNISFTPHVVNLGDEGERALFRAIWPLAKFPVLYDDISRQTVPESSILVEFLAQTQPSAATLIPKEPEVTLQVRLLDRLFDNYIHLPLQQIVGERMRPDDSHDLYGAEQARKLIREGYKVLESMIARPWAVGEAFTLADCAALPALYYADFAVKLTEWPELARYFDRLKARPSVKRVLAEAEPFLKFFPLKDG